MYLIDTDVLLHLQRGHARAQTRCDAIPRRELATTIITYIEILRARNESLLKAANASELARAQDRLD